MNVIYRSGDLIGQEQYFMNEMNIIYRNVDDQTMPVSHVHAWIEKRFTA